MNDNATIYYHDIGDYLTREQKLARIREFGSVGTMLKAGAFTVLQPNKHGDWINHRDEGYEELIPLAPERKFDTTAQSAFILYSTGLSTNRDAWVYNYSLQCMFSNMERTISFFNSGNRNTDPTQINWTRALRNDAEQNRRYEFTEEKHRTILYRPFCKQHCYSIDDFIEMAGINNKIFPTNMQDNLLIFVSGVGVSKKFDLIITDAVSDRQLMANGQCFPLYYYEKREQTEQMNLFDTGEEYTRRDGISDFILERVRELCGAKVTKPDIFYYVYGILHSEEYRAKYAVNLKKSLPRLPLPEDPKLFWSFSKAGARLAELHLNYETLPPWKELKEDSPKAKPSYRVTKMRFAKEGKEENKTAIVYNDEVTVWNIPLEAYDYVVNGKSAIEWIMERYQVTTHKESGIVNDPNLWCDEHNQPRYIIDLLKRIVTLSLETMKIVKALPKLGL